MPLAGDDFETGIEPALGSMAILAWLEARPVLIETERCPVAVAPLRRAIYVQAGDN